MNATERSRLLRLAFLASAALLLAGNLGLLVLETLGAVPGFASVRSAGFAFPALSDSRIPEWNVVILAALLATGLVLGRRSSDTGTQSGAMRVFHRGPSDALLVGLAVLVFCWGTYLAYPPQISFTNFRIIWVDWTTTDAKIRYVGQLLRSFSLDYPHLLQGAALLVTYLGVGGIAVRSGWGRGKSAAIALAACASSIFIEFAGVGEDWLLVSSFSLAVLWAYAARRWDLVLVAMLILGGIRMPAALLLLLAIVLVESLRTALLAKRRPRYRLKLIARTSIRLLALTGALLLSSYLLHIHFSRFGDGLAVVGSMNLEKIDVDGFVLSRFSGAYVGHALWALPPVLTAAAIAVVVLSWQHVRTAAGRCALASALAMGGSLLMYEAFVSNQYYYNYRYMSLSLAIGLPAAVYLLSRLPGRGPIALIVMLAITFAHPTNVITAISAEPTKLQLLEHELYSCRRALSPWIAGRTVHVESRAKSIANSVQYVQAMSGSHTPSGGVRAFRKRSTIGASDAILVRSDAIAPWMKQGGITRVQSCRGWTVLHGRQRK